MSETVFVDGMFFNERNDKSPEWILGGVSFQRDGFIEWLQAQETDARGYVKVDIKRAKSGKAYCALNTFKPRQQETTDDNDLPW